MATFKKSVLQKLFLFLLTSYSFAAPVAKDDVYLTFNPSDVEPLVQRAPLPSAKDDAYYTFKPSDLEPSIKPLAARDDIYKTFDPSSVETLSKRDHPLGSNGNPYHVYFNINGWEDIAEEDCRIALCELGGITLYQRQPGEAAGDQAYTDSGASTHPFYAANLSDRHTNQINPETTSAEEFPFRSLQLPASANGRRYVTPGTDAQQRSQGGHISDAYRTAGVGYNQWLEMHFYGAPLRVYCTALFKEIPDIEVCDEKPKEKLFGTENVQLADETFFKSDKKEGNKIVFEHGKPVS